MLSRYPACVPWAVIKKDYEQEVSLGLDDGRDVRRRRRREDVDRGRGRIGFHFLHLVDRALSGTRGKEEEDVDQDNTQHEHGRDRGALDLGRVLDDERDQPAQAEESYEEEEHDLRTRRGDGARRRRGAGVETRRMRGAVAAWRRRRGVGGAAAGWRRRRGVAATPRR